MEAKNELIIKDIQETDQQRLLQSYIMNLMDLYQAKLAMLFMLKKRIHKYSHFRFIFPIYLMKMEIQKCDLKLAIEDIKSEIDNKKMFVAEYIDKVVFDGKVKESKLKEVNANFDNLYSIALGVVSNKNTFIDEKTKANIVNILNVYGNLNKKDKKYDTYLIEVYEALYNELSIFL